MLTVGIPAAEDAAADHIGDQPDRSGTGGRSDSGRCHGFGAGDGGGHSGDHTRDGHYGDAAQPPRQGIHVRLG